MQATLRLPIAENRFLKSFCRNGIRRQRTHIITSRQDKDTLAATLTSSFNRPFRNWAKALCRSLIEILLLQKSGGG
jgi:hypothetical protein